MKDDAKIAELATLAKNGDTEAFAKIYEMICKDLYQTAYYILGKKEDAENAVSEAVLDAYAGLAKLRDPAAFRSWIFAILSNKCKAIQREYVKNRQHLAPEDPSDYEEILGREDQAIETAESRLLLKKAFLVLTEEEKRIVTLTIYGELDSGQIARALSLNRNTVRSKYKRALEKMKLILQ